MSAFTVYECRNCLEQLRVTRAQSGYPLRCPVCGRDEFRSVSAREMPPYPGGGEIEPPGCEPT